MTGHISYPRTAAGANAESDYEQAITLANGGEADRAKALLCDILDNPNAPPWLKRLAQELLTKLHAEAIREGFESPNKGIRFQAETGQRVIDAGIDIRSYELKFGPNGSVGAIDIETADYIVEVTISPGGKLAQIKELITNRQMNPKSKTVVLYAPGYGMAAGDDIVRAGALIVRTPEDLIMLLRTKGK